MEKVVATYVEGNGRGSKIKLPHPKKFLTIPFYDPVLSSVEPLSPLLECKVVVKPPIVYVYEVKIKILRGFYYLLYGG